MPTTQTKFVSGDPHSKGVYIFAQKKMPGEPILIEHVLDFSSSGPGSVSSGDTVQALKIPANCFVLKAGATVITAEGAACTATFGDATDPDGWDLEIDLNASAGTSTYSLIGTDAYATAGGVVYTADDTLDLVMGHDTDAAKISVWALIWPFATDLA